MHVQFFCSKSAYSNINPFQFRHLFRCETQKEVTTVQHTSIFTSQPHEETEDYQCECIAIFWLYLPFIWWHYKMSFLTGRKLYFVGLRTDGNHQTFTEVVTVHLDLPAFIYSWLKVWRIKYSVIKWWISLLEDKGESVIIVVVCLLTGITVQSEDQNLIPFQKQVPWSTVPLGDVSLNELMYLLHHFVW